jgi:hypothetical protein
MVVIVGVAAVVGVLVVVGMVVVVMVMVVIVQLLKVVAVAASIGGSNLFLAVCGRRLQQNLRQALERRAQRRGFGRGIDHLRETRAHVRCTHTRA